MVMLIWMYSIVSYQYYFGGDVESYFARSQLSLTRMITVLINSCFSFVCHFGEDVVFVLARPQMSVMMITMMVPM